MDVRHRRPGLTAAAGAFVLTSLAHAQPPAAPAPATPPAKAPATTAPLSSVTVSQLIAQPPVVRAYVHVRDGAGAIVPIGEAKVSATVAGASVPVRAARPFARDTAGITAVVLIDRSRSVQSPGFRAIGEGLRTWLGTLKPADRVAIVGFGASIDVLAPFDSDAAARTGAIDAVRPAEAATRLRDAVIEAYGLIDRQASELPERRVVVVVSDGQDDVVGGVSERELLDRVGRTRVPVFGIGVYRPPQTPDKDRGLETLGALARGSGGEFVRADEHPPAALVDRLSRFAGRSDVVELDCSACPRDGNAHHVEITVRAGTQALGDGGEVRLFAPPPPPAPVATTAPWWRWPGLGGVAVAVLVVAGALVLVARRRRPPVEVPAIAVPPPVSSPAAAPMAPEPPAQMPRPVRIRLTPIGIDGVGDARRASLDERLVLGRGAEADVVIGNDPEISSAHCQLTRRAARLFVRDLGSTNGTTLNGVPIIGEQRVEDADVIGIGRSEFRLSIDEAGDAGRS